MLFASLFYLTLALVALISLTLMILRIGSMMSDCSGLPAARAASVTIATGYGAIGFGMVLMIGAGVVLFAETPFVGTLITSGFVALCLGLGFSQAISTLRAVLNTPAATAAATKPKTDKDEASVAPPHG